MVYITCKDFTLAMKYHTVLLQLRTTPTIIKMEQMSNSSHQHTNSPNSNDVLFLMDNSYVKIKYRGVVLHLK